ncbi:MAG: class I SAM-dependent methyltransferase [Nocardioidaceae bacterium]
MGDHLDEVRRDWERLGAEDPLWAVLMKPGTRHGGWDVDEFLATGRAEVDAAMTRLRDLAPELTLRRVLDFGCGAGRTAQALRRHSEAVLGVDISAPMLEIARRLDESGSCDFVLNDRPDLSAFGDGAFDLAYSSLVLQHLPPEVARAFLGELGRVVRPGGAVVVQVATKPTASAKGWLFRVAPRRLLRFGQRRILGYPAPMRMHAITAGDVAAALAPHGLDVVATEEDTTYGGHWTYHRYFAVKRAAT